MEQAKPRVVEIPTTTVTSPTPAAVDPATVAALPAEAPALDAAPDAPLDALDEDALEDDALEEDALLEALLEDALALSPALDALAVSLEPDETVSLAVSVLVFKDWISFWESFLCWEDDF